MRRLSELLHIDGDEVGLVKRGANRRRLLVRKEDTVAELDDMLAVPVAYEGALTDLLRKEGTDEAAIEGAIAGLRLLKAVEEDMPEAIREEIAKLGSQMYPIVNKPLNNLDGADDPNDGPNDSDADDTAKAGPDADDDNDPDGDDVKKRDFDPGVGGGVDRDKLPEADFAGPNRTYPIVTQQDVTDAMELSGKAADPAAVKARIGAIARRKGLTPPGESKKNVNKEGVEVTDGTAEVAVPVPIKKDDGTWDLSGVPEESRDIVEAVLKARDEIADDREKVQKENTDLRTRVEKVEDTLAAREFLAKAEEFKHVAAPDDLGPVLKECATALSAEHMEVLTKALASAEERITMGEKMAKDSASPAVADIFKEYGRSGTPKESAGDAWAQIEKEADSLIEKSDEPLSKAQAISKFLETPRGKELYGQYQREV